MTILNHINVRRAAEYSVLLLRNVCFAYAFHQQVLLKFWQPPPWVGFLTILLLTALFSPLLARMHVFSPFHWWKHWRWYQKIGLVFASAGICLLLLKSGLVSPSGYSDTTITVTASKEKDVTSFYCAGLFDHKGRPILSPQQMAEEAEVLQCFQVVNDGKGLWCRMPDMGTTLQIRWRGKIQDKLFPVHFLFSVHPTAGTVTVEADGITNTVNLHGKGDFLKKVSLPSESRSVPKADVLAVWLTLLFLLPRFTLFGLGIFRNDFFVPLANFAAKHSVLTSLVLIALPVIAFNAIHVFEPKFLLEDDPFFYRIGIGHMVDWWRWQVFGSLAAFTEGFSYYVMAHFSPYVVRLMYLFVYLTGISFCVYWIARRILGLNPVCCYLAAVLPAIYPIQYLIIAGINSSYTLIGTLMVLLSLVAGFTFLIQIHYSWLMFVLAAGLYGVSTRLMEHSIFLSASLGLIYMMSTQNWKRKAILLFAIAFFASMELYRMVIKPRGEVAIPHNLFWDDIFERGRTFLLYLSPTNGHFAIWLFALLLAASIIGYCWSFRSQDATHTLPHFAWLPRKLAFFILPAFALLWTIPSALPFIGMTKYFSIRMFHVAGYGPWLFIAPGLHFFILRCTSFILPKFQKLIMIALVGVMIGEAGVRHMIYAKDQYRPGNYYFESLSRAISKHAIPEDTQIVITNASTGTSQSYPLCTGYLSRMLGNRLDVEGLVGNEFFFYDSFAQTNLWLRPMTGLDASYDTLCLFRWVPSKDIANPQQNGSLQPYKYFLRVLTDESLKTDAEKTGDWFIYRLNTQGKTDIIHSGHGLQAYRKMLAKLELDGIDPDQICWGNPANQFGCNSPSP